jgi:hypothetical protein
VDEVTPSNGEIELHANNGEIELRANNVGIQEAELSLQEGGSLHHEVGASSCYIKLLMTTDGTMGRVCSFVECAHCLEFSITSMIKLSTFMGTVANLALLWDVLIVWNFYPPRLYYCFLIMFS